MKRVMLLFLLCCCAPASAGVQTYVNDPNSFYAVAGPTSNINFSTLPDGSPNTGGTPLTSSFNYDIFGAHFSALTGTVYAGGQTADGWWDIFGSSGISGIEL